MSNDLYDLIVVTDFDESNVKTFRRQVLEQSFARPKEPIVIYIESYGGSVDGMASMVEVIQAVPNEIHTVCTGMAMSAGAFLLSFGDVRYCGEYSRIMLHEISGGFFGTTSQVVNDAKEHVRLQRFWFDHLAANCGLKNSKEVERILNRYDYYLNAEQALEMGLVHHVGLPEFKKKKAKRKKTTTRTRRKR